MCMLSVCLARCVIFSREISLLYNYTVIRYTRGRISNNNRTETFYFLWELVSLDDIGGLNSVKQPATRQLYDSNAGNVNGFEGLSQHRDNSDEAVITHRLGDIIVN
jgi:hypothetical protein